MVRIFIPGESGAAGVTMDLASPGAPATSAAPPAQIAKLYEIALTNAAMGLHQPAMKALRELTSQAPNHEGAWRKLAELRRLAGLTPAAEAALERATQAARHPQPPPRAPDPRTQPEFDQVQERVQQEIGDVAGADPAGWLRGQLAAKPKAVVPMRLLANLELQAGDTTTGRALLERAVEISPGYEAARLDLVHLLMAQRHDVPALAHTRTLRDAAPRNPLYRAMLADTLRSVGDLAGALEETEALLRSGQRKPAFLAVYAQALHFAGRGAEAVQFYREALQAAPATAEAWWGLAELRGRFLTAADIATLREQLQSVDLDPASRSMMLFALGHALEDASDFEPSFAAYQEGAELFRQAAAARGGAHDAGAATRLAARQRETFTPATFAVRAGAPNAAPPATTPIFIVGMPRAGSTLVEQILASHSLVEATLELPLIGQIARDVGESRALVKPDAYPEIIPTLATAELDSLGARYLAQAAAYRRTTRPFFIDKRPANWRHIGLIRLILPQAKIIDVRRAPMAACFAVYKQFLLSDANYSYSLTDTARFFTDYTSLMQHWHSMQPGQIHPLSYESLVENSETEIRALLEYCGLPFEPACLRFWETTRAVATPSAEQVRRPIFRDAVAQWENYAPWLGELKEALK